MNSKNKTVIAIVAVALVLVGLFAWGKNNQKNDIRTWNDTSVRCLPNGHQNLGLHIHQNLSIVILGQEQVIPNNIGINDPICMAEAHTHDEPGKIHVESIDASRKITLGDFFSVWGKTFNQNQILDSINGEKGMVKFLVNGQPNSEFEKYILKDHDKIEIRFE